MMSAAPVVSFVTPSFNRRDFLVRCIESIPKAYRLRVEHIIVDGGSTDGSVELIKKYPHVRLISEPDNGLYDAANKGIRLASGKYVGFLATDDFISGEFFEKFFGDSGDWNLNSAILSFDFFNHVGEVMQRRSAATFDLEGIFQGRTPLFSLLVRRDILRGLSGFDASYRIAGDFELTLRMVRLGLDSHLAFYPMQNFWMHEGSLTGHSGSARDKEYWEVVRCIAEQFFPLVAKKGFYRLARRKVADVARYIYRNRGLRSLVASWRLMIMVLLMGIDFR